MNKKENNDWIRHSYDLKNYEDLGGCYKPWQFGLGEYNTILDLYNSSNHTLTFTHFSVECSNK